MDGPAENRAADEPQVDRRGWFIQKGRLGDERLENRSSLTPEERLALVWPLTVQAWAFGGVDVAESRLPRHLMHITRRAR
jgi:hypothetical protein